MVITIVTNGHIADFTSFSRLDTIMEVGKKPNEYDEVDSELVVPLISSENFIVSYIFYYFSGGNILVMTNMTRLKTCQSQ